MLCRTINSSAPTDFITCCVCCCNCLLCNCLSKLFMGSLSFAFDSGSKGVGFGGRGDVSTPGAFKPPESPVRFGAPGIPPCNPLRLFTKFSLCIFGGSPIPGIPAAGGCILCRECICCTKACNGSNCTGIAFGGCSGIGCPCNLFTYNVETISVGIICCKNVVNIRNLLHLIDYVH